MLTVRPEWYIELTDTLPVAKYIPIPKEDERFVEYLVSCGVLSKYLSYLYLITAYFFDL